MRNNQGHNDLNHLNPWDDVQLNLRDGSDFHHKWPDGDVTKLVKVKEGTANYQGAEYRVKVGYTDYEGLGTPTRPRAVVFLEGRTLIFTGANDYSESGIMASVIKVNKRHVQDASGLPPIFRRPRVEPYRVHVDGPRAAHGLAVICRYDDHKTMIAYGVIRYREDLST